MNGDWADYVIIAAMVLLIVGAIWALQRGES